MRRRLAWIALATLLLALSSIALRQSLAERQVARRGIWFAGQPLPAADGAPTPLGTTVELTQYESDAELDGALEGARRLGLLWLRQRLPWDAIEPAAGRYDWAPYDRVIERADAAGFRLILVIDRTPAWARDPQEQDNPLAPPADLAPLATFARAAAERYGPRVAGWQVWDEPNLMPHSGTERLIDPADYARLLHAVAPALRAADPDGIVATAGLAPTVEPGGFNMSEIRFVEGLYAAGAADDFDAVALKAFGFWMGPTDRLYDESVLSIDRVVLVREVMERYGDGGSPIWLVEGGWATLPPDWQGDPPPWGSDAAPLQQARLASAGRRIALEWPWVQLVALQELAPDVAPTDPRRGLALLDDDGLPTPLGETITELADQLFTPEARAAARAEWRAVEGAALQAYDRDALLLALVVLVAATTVAWHGLQLPWERWAARFRALPEEGQIALLAGAVVALIVIDPLVPSLLLYAVVGLLILWRLELGLAAAVFLLPYFLRPKALGPLRFAHYELLLLLCLVAWLWRVVRASEPWRARLRRLLWPRDLLDLTVVLLVLWGLLSIPLASQLGVAMREFRVVLLDSALLYWLVRRGGLDGGGRRRLVDALVLGGTGMALIALGQWLFTGDVIRAEGVRRALGLYGSPNNLALLLERLLPISVALTLLGPDSRRRRLYALATVPLALTLFLTFSRGAWLVGMPAALLAIGWWGDRRSRRWLGAAAVVGLLALLPFAATERIASATDLGGGTWFIRRQLWEATLAMIADSPLVGVGLDNFLYVYEQYRLPEAWREPDLSHPHQLLLHVWVALGLPGVALLLTQQAAFWRAWARARRRVGAMARPLLVGLGASMVATLAHGLIDNAFFLVDLAAIWMLTLALVAEMEIKDS